jgi:hypothetical protein
MKNPIKIIHKFKNSNRRTQYKIYIFVGSLVSNDILKILKSIEDKDFISSYQYLEKNMIVKLEEYYGLKWYEYFFTSYHINNQIEILKNNINKKKILETKMGKEWLKNLINEPIVKKVSYSYAASYYNYLLMRNKIKTQTRKVEMDFRTYELEKSTMQIENTQDTAIDINLLEQDGGTNEEVPDEKENIEMYELKDDEITEREISEDEINEMAENDFNVNNLSNVYLETDVDSVKSIKDTTVLISDTLHDKKWDKEIVNLGKTYDDSVDGITFDAKLEEVYKKHYITSQYIFTDDTIRTLRQKICISVPLNPKFGQDLKLVPEAQYFWSEYTFEGKIDQVMLGQKWIRRNELLKIDIKPNENLKVYEKLRNNLSYLKDSFGYKLKREDDENNILDYYDDFMTNNEIFMVDIYNEFGLNYTLESEDKKNLYEVYINIYFPGITYERMENILALLNGKDNKEIQNIENIFGTIKNDIKLETEIYENIELAKTKMATYEKYFLKNYIIQTFIHINVTDPKNITGTTSDTKFNLYRIFDNFIVNDQTPFIQYQTPDSNITYKFFSKLEKVEEQDLLSKWFETASYGISVKVKQENGKYIAINIHESGRLECKVTFKEEELATLDDIYATYDIVRNLLKKINSENKKIKFILPTDDRFKFAFINTIQKFKLPEDFKINHNDLSDFSRFFFPYVSVVIDPKKRESTKNILKTINISKYGTYLRYKRISKYDNRTKMQLRILYFLRNYELSNKELLDEIAKQFNITPEAAVKELDLVKEKYSKALKKSKKTLKHIQVLPRSKPPGIDISIQGKDRDNYKIRITGARDKKQLDEIINFMKVLIFLYIEAYHYKNKEYQKLREILKTLTKIAKRRNKVEDLVSAENPTKNVKAITGLDKKRLAYKPEEGQNQWTRNCQNSGTDKKRRPDIIIEDNISKLTQSGYVLNKKTDFYEKTVTVKNKKIVIRAIKLPDDDGKFNYFTCNPDENQDHMFVGFLTKSSTPENLCIPCCFKKDHLTGANKFKKNYYKKCVGLENVQQPNEKADAIQPAPDKIYILQDTNKIQDGRFIKLPEYLDIFFNTVWNN